PCDHVGIKVAIRHMIEPWDGPVVSPLTRHDVFQREVALDCDNLALLRALSLLDSLEKIPQAWLPVRFILVTSDPPSPPLVVLRKPGNIGLACREQGVYAPRRHLSAVPELGDHVDEEAIVVRGGEAADVAPDDIGLN